MTPERIIDHGTWKITLPANGGLSAIDRPNNTWDSFDWGPMDCPETDFPDRKIADWGAEQLGKNHATPCCSPSVFTSHINPFLHHESTLTSTKKTRFSFRQPSPAISTTYPHPDASWPLAVDQRNPQDGY